jgi:hypothetical protein
MAVRSVSNRLQKLSFLTIDLFNLLLDSLFLSFFLSFFLSYLLLIFLFSYFLSFLLTFLFSYLLGLDFYQNKQPDKIGSTVKHLTYLKIIIVLEVLFLVAAMY